MEIMTRSLAPLAKHPSFSSIRSTTMRSLLLFALLAQVHCQVYEAITASRERKSILGPFKVPNQAACELACNCARGDASGQDCAQFSGVVPQMDCLIYYYTPSWCSFLGDYTVNTCILPIVEYQLQQNLLTSTTTDAATTTGCPSGGVWSEWTYDSCPTTCGGNSNVTRTRTCTNRCGDCACEGPSSDIGPCGIALCPFPIKTCLTPYVKCLNNDTSTFFCGTENIPHVVCAP